MIEQYKNCTYCNELKPFSEFWKGRGQFGLHCYCKPCLRQRKREKYDKKYNQTEKGKIARRKAVKKYFQSEYGHAVIQSARRAPKRVEREKQYRITRKDILRKKVKENYHNKPLVKLAHSVRTRLRYFLKKSNINKYQDTFSYIGCTLNELKFHLEKQFTNDMSWNNHGKYGWHIDHIIPLASATTPEDIYKLCHYTNLQPLWAHENWSKGAKKL